MKLKPLTVGDAADFLGKIRKTPTCWLWPDRTEHGPRFRNRTVQHVSWILHRGQLQKGHGIASRCGNTSCVRPSHLFSGTPRELADHRAKSSKGAHADPAAADLYARITAMRVARLSWAAIGAHLGMTADEVRRRVVRVERLENDGRAPEVLA